MAKKVLITGFEPFLEFKTNPSASVALTLDGQTVGDVAFFGRVLPVDYENTGKELVRFIEEVEPDLIIGTGLAAGRSKLSLEKIAANYKFSFEPDNAGNRASGEKIDPEMPDGMFSLLEVEQLFDVLNQKGIPSEVSMTAGAYLCNYAMFVIVRESRRLGIRGGFIHLPADTALAATFRKKTLPSMNIDALVEGVRTIALHESGTL